MSDKKSSAKKCTCEDCNCGRSVLPICFLVCALTAVLVALVFAISFTAIFTTELRHKYGNKYSGDFLTEYRNNTGSTVMPLSAGATIDMFESGATGFLMIGEYNNERSNSFYAAYSKMIETVGNSNEFFVFNYGAENADEKAEQYAISITLDTESAPALLYVRNGKIHDRLDSIYDESILNTFIMKYRTSVAK